MSGFSNHPFAPRRRRRDLVAALPAIGMIVGAVLGVGLGLLNPEESAVKFAGIGIGAGLLLGVFLRLALRDGDGER